MKADLEGAVGAWPDGSTIRGRQRVRVVCAICNGIIGKVMENTDWGAWINLYVRTGTRWADHREVGADRVESTVTVRGARLQMAGSAPRDAWCDRDHQVRSVETAIIVAALERAKRTGKVVRIAV